MCVWYVCVCIWHVHVYVVARACMRTFASVFESYFSQFEVTATVEQGRREIHIYIYIIILLSVSGAHNSGGVHVWA